MSTKTKPKRVAKRKMVKKDGKMVFKAEVQDIMLPAMTESPKEPKVEVEQIPTRRSTVDPAYKLATDGLLGQCIPLLPQERIKHKSPYFPAGNLSIVLAGKSGSGKSTFLLQIIPQIENLSQIIVLTRIVGNRVNDAIKTYCDNTICAKTGEPIEFAIAYDNIEAEGILEDIVGRKAEDTWGLVIMDDWGQHNASRTDPYNMIANTVVCKWRNHGYHCATLSQDYSDISVLSRNNANMRVFFEEGRETCLRLICDDWRLATGRSNEDFLGLHRLIKAKKYSFVLISEDKVYLYIKGEMDVPADVHFTSIDEEELRSDQRLARIAAEMIALNKKVASQGRTALIRRDLAHAEERLKQYAEYLARESEDDVDSVREVIYKLYNV